MDNIKPNFGVELHSSLIRSLISLDDYFKGLPVSVVDANDNSFSLGEADIFEISKRLNSAIKNHDCFIDNIVIYPKSDSVRVFVMPRDKKFETPGI